MTTVKVTQFLRDFIASKAKWNESIDYTLRRLLKMDVVKVEEASA
jgi:negative regulator of replication initiation